MRGAVRDWARGLRGACPRYPPALVTRHSPWDILAYLVDTWDLDIEAVNQDYKRALSARGCLHGTSGLRAVPAGPGGRRKQPDQAHLSMTAGKKLTHSLQRLM